MSEKQTDFTEISGEKEVVTKEVDQCPVCSERDYITVDNKTGAITCLSCGYDNSMSKKFSAPDTPASSKGQPY